MCIWRWMNVHPAAININIYYRFLQITALTILPVSYT